MKVLKSAFMFVVCSVFAVSAQIPTIRITTQNNQAVDQTCTGMQFMGMCMGTTSNNYVRITNFQITDPGNSRNNLTISNLQDSVRVRGNSTAGANKKPYRLKFQNRQSLFGLESARSWVLLADYYDYTLSLNAMALELGKRLGLEFTNSWRHVDVYINNTYMGIYLFTEQVQVNPGRVDVDKNAGWLVEFDYHTPESHHITFTTTGGNISMPARVRDPEVENNFNISNPLVSFVQTQVNALFTAMADSRFPENGYRDLIDLESWAKYVLIQQLIDNFDFNSKVQRSEQFGQPGSNYAYKDAGRRIHAGPLWDFDLAAGLVDPGSGGPMSNTWPRHYVTYQEPIRPRHPFYQRLWEDPVFLAKFKKNWDRHQLTFNAMPAFLDSIANTLSSRVQANFAAYTGGPNEVRARPNSEQTYRAHVNDLKTWWGQRMTFFGQQINAMNIDTTRDINQNPTSIAYAAQPVKPGKSLAAVKNGFKINASNSASIKVINLNGSVVRKQNFTRGNHTITLENLPKGMYVVNITVDNKKQVLRVPVR